MAKITIDIEYVKSGLEQIGYIISDIHEHENNGTFWQIKFSNSGAIVTVYDTNKKENSVVNGKATESEKSALKSIVDGLKCKKIAIDPLNQVIVSLINSHREGATYDFKSEFYGTGKKADMLHDILCLSNNIENTDAYLIFGVRDDYEVIGIEQDIRSNDVFDFLKTIKFAGGHMPEIEIKHLYHMEKRIAVIVCKSSKYVPFYITERCDKVHPNQIYTRVGDTNTPINQQANYLEIEKLWRFHFMRENE